MKNSVEETILAFSRQETREFKYLLRSGSKQKSDRKDLQLTDQIRQGKDSASRNVNADHQTKKRLKKQLERFAMLENLRHDKFSEIHALMETAKYLFRKNLHNQAWEYLLKAEQMAMQTEEYILLEYNYSLQIAYSYNIATHLPAGFSVPGLLTKWEEAKELALVDSNANAAYALLVDELRKQFSKQLSIDIDELTRTILKRYGLDEIVYDNKLRIYCKIVNLVCRALREKREYHSMKKYAISSYRFIEKKKALDKISPDFLIDLLDAICIATLRSKDYTACEKYTRLYETQAKHMQAHRDEYSYYDFIQYIGVSDLCLCTDRLDEAREAMLTAKKKYARYTASARIYFLLRVNLLAVHFPRGEYDICIRLYNEIKTLNDREILNEPGFRLELVLFTDIYGILFHYEDGDIEYALYLLNKFKRKHSQTLELPDSRREKLFISVVELMLTKPSYVRSEKFHTDAERFIKLKDFIAGDFEYISMNAWLQAKMSNKTYYNCFLELVQ
jgi:hypothetical protein